MLERYIPTRREEAALNSLVAALGDILERKVRPLSLIHI